MSNSLRPHPWVLQARILERAAFPFSRGSYQTQELNPGLPHCRQILYQLSHKGSPRTLEWAAYPFSRGSSWPRSRTGVSCIAGGFFTNWAMREAMRGVWLIKPCKNQSLSANDLFTSWHINTLLLFFFLEKAVATHSSILAWRIPWTEEPGGLLSMGSHRVGHDWSDLAYSWD